MLRLESQTQPLLSACVVFVTCASLEEGEKLASVIVTDSLAACVNLIPGVRSIYMWPDESGESKLCHGQEVQLVIKTQSSLLSDLEAKIKRLHSYEMPEFIVLPIVGGSSGYLDWLADMTQAGGTQRPK